MNRRVEVMISLERDDPWWSMQPELQQ